MIQIGNNNNAWLRWIAIEPIHSLVLGVYLSRHRNILVAESFLKSLVKSYGKHSVYSDGGIWYLEACSSLGLKHRLHSSFEKSIIERSIRYFKDRTECFDDYFPGTKSKCKLQHIRNWFNLFVGCYNRGNS
jgi:putative transposase